VLRGGKPKAIIVDLGLDDDAYAEVVAGNLQRRRSDHREKRDARGKAGLRSA
jgi:hypothetical protein